MDFTSFCRVRYYCGTSWNVGRLRNINRSPIVHFTAGTDPRDAPHHLPQRGARDARPLRRHPQARNPAGEPRQERSVRQPAVAVGQRGTGFIQIN